MKLWETFRYELAYQLRNVSTWVYFLLLLVLSYFMAAAIFTDEPLAGGYFLNAPFIVAKVSLITFFLMGMLVLAQFAGNAATRDLESRMHPLLYTTPISKHIYLGGRFLAAFALGSLVMLAIPAGVFAAALFPMEDAGLVGPLSAANYLSTYFLLLLPNAFFAVAFMFATAVLSKKGILTYLIAVLIGVVAISSWQILGVQEKNWALANLTDPIGISKITELKKAWSANEKNTLLPATENAVLLNRVVWIALSFGILLATYLQFKRGTVAEKRSKKKQNLSAPAAPTSFQLTEHVAIPQVQKDFDFSTRLLQMLTVGRESFRIIALGWGWMAMACMFAFVFFTGPMWFSDYYDIPELPVTGNLLATLENTMEHGIWFIIPLLIIYYAGELVWRNRDARLNEIIGAAPVPVWVSFAGKLGGMILALIIMQLLLMVASILVQVSMGYYNFQLPVYLKILLGIRLADYVLLAVLAFAVHVVLNQKYMAHLVCVLIYVFALLGPEFGIDSRLLLYGSDPGWAYSDLRGLEPFMGPWLFFKSYWGAWGLLLAVMTVLLWPRGTEYRLQKRFQQGIRKNGYRIKAIAGLSMLLIVVLGGLIFYNTEILYPETNFVETLEWKAEYEKKYGKYRDSRQPSVTKTRLRVEIYPDEKAVDFKGTYVLVNRTASEIDTIFLSTAPGVTNHALNFNTPVKQAIVDEELEFRMYILNKPILPGDSVMMEFHVTYEPQGFPNSGINTTVVTNGTYFADVWLPTIGYKKSREIYKPQDRESQGLKAKTIIDPDMETFGERIDFETVIGTNKGLTALAPGKLIKSWTENDRSYFQYAAEQPIKNKFGFVSSDYKVHEAQWRSDSGQAVDIKILHHPQHTLNNEGIIKSAKASLAFMSREFGKYPHSELRFTEVPGYNKGLFAYTTNILYREGFAHLKPAEDPRGLDMVFATVAHEVCHQWWGSQVSPAPIKGAALITESLAWYSAMEIIEEARGQKEFLGIIKMARDDYFTPQEREADPLLEASQTSIIYRKGPLALYALREYIGKNQLRLALRNFFKKYSNGTALPLPKDLYRELQIVTPGSLQYLLNDLFATNTFWELKTEKAVAAQTPSGKWKVTIDVSARKFTVDKKGTETDVEMNDWMQIGVYGEPGETKAGRHLHLQQHRLRSGLQRIEIEVTGKPGSAGIDPNFLLIDLENYDNVTKVETR
jgi:ABC-2 type transport system permease protein